MACPMQRLVLVGLYGIPHAETSDRRFSLERTERNLTSNIKRMSVISDSGEEVQYAIVSKPNSET